jgi:hypothetical protein
VIALLVVLQTAVGSIKGEVIDTAFKPVPGVAVEIVGSPLSARTDTLGAYRIDKLPVGRYMVHVGHVAKMIDVVADTAVYQTFMARNVPAPHLVWLGCKPFGTCDQMRYVATFRQHNIPPGVGVVRDSTVWSAFLTRHATGSNASIRDDVVDWTHEMLVIVCDAGINRVEPHPDKLSVLLGPDSVSGTPPVEGAPLATVIAVKRTPLSVQYRAILPTTRVPPTLDWSAQ